MIALYFALHPLIHTILELNLVQDIESCQGGGVEGASITMVAGHVQRVTG